MALVNGADYDHIDLQTTAGGNTIRHMLQDTAGRAMLAPMEANTTASIAYATGDYFILSGTLYQATADIAIGGTIVPNTNCEAVTVGGQLGDLKSAIDVLEPVAAPSDVGKVLTVKSVNGGKVSQYEFKAADSTDSALSTTSKNPVQNKIITNALGPYNTLSEYGTNITEILEWLIDMVENPIDPNAVDICVFAGQSNMDGRGDASEASTVQTGTAFRWDSSQQAVVDFTAESSLIPAYAKTYYEKARVPIVEIKEATGGININQWMTTWGSATAPNITGCKNYLESHGKTVRRVFMLWNQGENDVFDSTTESEYETYFAQMKSAAMAAGVEKIFMIRIGHDVGNPNLNYTIMEAQSKLCKKDKNFVLVSKKAASYVKAPGLYYSDTIHLNQKALNAVGYEAGKTAGKYVKKQSKKKK